MNVWNKGMPFTVFTNLPKVLLEENLLHEVINSDSLGYIIKNTECIKRLLFTTGLNC